MWFLDQIVSALKVASDWFYRLYRDFSDVPLIGGVLAAGFYWLYTAFYHLATYFSSFNAWVEDATSKLGRILSLENIASYFKTFLDYATNAWAWITNAWNNVIGIVSTWWQTVKPVVLAWIEEAKSWVKDQLKDLLTWLGGIQRAVDAFLDKLPSLSEIILWWKDWWGNVTKVITDWWPDGLEDVKELDDTQTKDNEPFWKGWQDVRDSVIEFINDPLEWLANRLEDWFWGEEE
jgi:hypothetical protein